MTRLIRSKSCARVEYSTAPPTPILREEEIDDQEDYDGEEEEEFENDDEEALYNSATTPFSSKARHCDANINGDNNNENSNHQFAIVDILVTALRKSIVTCSVERDDVSSSSSSLDISWPTEVRHVSHVTFDRFNGFLGLPTELEPQLPRRVPSASVSVFGVSEQSMQCTYDDRGNSVPTILLMMQKRLYSGGGLQAEGIFRINAENGQEELVRDRLNKGVVPHGIDVHCLAGLIKAWFRELPRGVLDSLSAEQVMQCNTEEDCSEAVNLLPATEASLLDWSVNLMADVVHHEHFNKMNARNIAMVFAPNMTQMSDPLTALIHAVQVMNFLKTLIVKTLREREEAHVKPRRLFLSKPAEACSDSGRRSVDEPSIDEKLWCNNSQAKTKEEDLAREEEEEEGQENKARRARLADHFRRRDEESGDWLSLRRGVRRLCRHSVFNLNRPSKKTPTLGVVNTNARETAGQAWA